MPTGKVRWYNPTKGYGFIKADGIDKDIFVHARQVQAAKVGDLEEGDELSFDLGKGEKGSFATNLARV